MSEVQCGLLESSHCQVGRCGHPEGDSCHTVVSSGVALHKNRCRSRFSSASSTALYIFEMSAEIATGYIRKQSRMVSRFGSNVGPVRRVSLSEIEFDALALASKTMHSLVLVQLALTTPCIGR